MSHEVQNIANESHEMDAFFNPAIRLRRIFNDPSEDFYRKTKNSSLVDLDNNFNCELIFEDEENDVLLVISRSGLESARENYQIHVISESGQFYDEYSMTPGEYGKPQSSNSDVLAAILEVANNDNLNKQQKSKILKSLVSNGEISRKDFLILIGGAATISALSVFAGKRHETVVKGAASEAQKVVSDLYNRTGLNIGGLYHNFLDRTEASLRNLEAKYRIFGFHKEIPYGDVKAIISNEELFPQPESLQKEEFLKLKSLFIYATKIYPFLASIPVYVWMNSTMDDANGMYSGNWQSFFMNDAFLRISHKARGDEAGVAIGDETSKSKDFFIVLLHEFMHYIDYSKPTEILKFLTYDQLEFYVQTRLSSISLTLQEWLNMDIDAVRSGELILGTRISQIGSEQFEIERLKSLMATAGISRDIIDNTAEWSNDVFRDRAILLIMQKYSDYKTKSVNTKSEKELITKLEYHNNQNSFVDTVILLFNHYLLADFDFGNEAEYLPSSFRKRLEGMFNSKFMSEEASSVIDSSEFWTKINQIVRFIQEDQQLFQETESFLEDIAGYERVAACKVEMTEGLPIKASIISIPTSSDKNTSNFLNFRGRLYKIPRDYAKIVDHEIQIDDSTLQPRIELVLGTESGTEYIHEYEYSRGSFNGLDLWFKERNPSSYSHKVKGLVTRETESDATTGSFFYVSEGKYFKTPVDSSLPHALITRGRVHHFYSSSEQGEQLKIVDPYLYSNDAKIEGEKININGKDYEIKKIHAEDEIKTAIRELSDVQVRLMPYNSVEDGEYLHPAILFEGTFFPVELLEYNSLML